MKLRTELKNTRHNGIIAIGVSVEDTQHDLLAAHALMQAMKEIEANGCGCDPADVPEVIRNHADKLMSAWGFERDNREF